jgi:hypothetical protein
MADKGVQNRIAAGAAAYDHLTLGIRQPLFGQGPGAPHGVLHIQKAPFPLRGIPVGAPVAGAPPIIHFQISEAPRGEELGIRVVAHHPLGGGAAVDADEGRGQAHSPHLRRGRWVIQAVDSRPVRRAPLNGLGEGRAPPAGSAPRWRTGGCGTGRPPRSPPEAGGQGRKRSWPGPPGPGPPRAVRTRCRGGGPGA